MSKKFRLIKWYPSLVHFFKEGDIVTFEDDESIKHLGFAKGYNWVLLIQEVEDSPEYWEPIKEKEYEILSFKSNANSIFKKLSNGNFGSKEGVPGSSEERLLRDSYVNIYSIKRLSDGEVFTVGDKVRHFIYTTQKYNNWTINKIRLVDNMVKLYSGTGFYKYLNDTFVPVGHRPSSLFITEDGINVYEGDTYYFVDKNKTGIIVKYTPANKTQSGKNPDRFLYFSDREKAKEYLDDVTTPKYSEKDIRSAIKNIEKKTFVEVEDLFKELGI